MGGKARGVQQRTLALAAYYQNPNTCVMCNAIIHVRDNERVCQTRRRKFCCYSCSARYSNTHRIRSHKPKIAKPPKQRPPAHFGVTKGDLFNRRKNYQSARSTIRDHANDIYCKSHTTLACERCGYDKHIEVAHRRSVSSFPSTAFIAEINDPSNLIGLCPNCHWEFDNLP
jgi:hypothetical protein